mgnify:CR=1 FL=1
MFTTKHYNYLVDTITNDPDISPYLSNIRVERFHILNENPPDNRSLIKKSGWRLWLNANGDFSLGTFICLWDDGRIERITWHSDGTESVFEVKDAQEA